MALASRLSLDAVLQRIVELAVDLTGARYGALGVLTPRWPIDPGIHHRRDHARGASGPRGPTDRPRPARRLTRQAPPHPDPGHRRRPALGGVPAEPPPMTSLLGARIIGRGTVFGNIYLTDKQAQRCSTRRTNASSWSSRPRRRSPSRTRGSTTRPERRGGRSSGCRCSRQERIGKAPRRRHPVAVGMSLQGPRHPATREGSARRGARGGRRCAIRDLRNYIFGLRPGILADRQLDQALKELATVRARSGVVTVVDVDGEAASTLASREWSSCARGART